MNIRPQFRPILVFCVIILLLLMVQRMAAILLFADWSELYGSRQYLAAFVLRALRFDLKYLSALLLLFVWLPSLLFALFSPRWFTAYLNFMLKLLLFLTLYVVFIDLGYLYYFQKPIDVLIFGFLQDDTVAILLLMLDNFLLILLFALFILFAALSIKIFSRFSSLPQSAALFALSRADSVPWLIVFVVLVLLARGSFDTFPLQRKHASVSDNGFLNALVMNSPFNLYYAWKDYRVNDQKIFQQNLLKQHRLESYQQLLGKAGYEQKSPLLRQTPEDEHLESLKPHVVFVQMEGWSAYIARKQSKQNNVLGAFAPHAQQDHFYTKFFSNRYATNPTIENLLLNSPITPLSQSVASQTRFSLSNVAPFVEKGYETLSLSGGYSSWRNHDRFWLNQGFDQYVGRSKIENIFGVDASDNPWGVYEAYVFRYLEESLMQAEADGKSLFSFVLTTNNHPPVRLPASFKMPSLQPEVYGFEADDEVARSALSGFYYQTDQFGRFIDWVKQSPIKDRVIIVATGDHPLRQFGRSNTLKDQYVRYAVATYIYVPESLDKLTSVSSEMAGSHNDLFPTLFELSLSGAQYYNFGQPLMEKSVDTAYGWSAHGTFIFDQGVADEKTRQLYPWVDDEQLWLAPSPVGLTKRQASAVDHEHYRKILKQYLLVRDYQRQSIDKNVK